MDIKGFLALLETKVLRKKTKDLETRATNLENGKFDKTGGDLTGNTRIKKDVPTFLFNANRTNESSIKWNANATTEGGLEVRVDGNYKYRFTASGDIQHFDGTNYFRYLHENASYPEFKQNLAIHKGVPSLSFNADNSKGSPRIFWNASATADYGFNIDSVDMVLQFKNADKKLLFTRDKTNYYEVLDKGNTPNVSWEKSNESSFTRAYTTSGTGRGVNSTWYKFPFNAVNYDNKGEFDTTNQRFNALNSGLYQVNVNIRWGTFSQGTEVKIAIYKNGVAERTLYTDTKYYNKSGYTSGGSSVVSVNNGDYLEVFYWLNSGSDGANATAMTDTYFEIVRVR